MKYYAIVPAAGILLICGVCFGGGDARLAPPKLVASSPATQAGVDNSQSTLSKTFLMSSAGQLDVDYVVDSELNYDQFHILIDGAVMFSASGPAHGGIATVPIGAGSHVVTLSYAKDVSESKGLDRAIVRSVVTRVGSVITSSETFEHYGTSVPGWTPGGTGLPAGVGWGPTWSIAERSAGRPGAHSILGNQPASSQSSMSAWINWASAGTLEFDYFVDSEPSYDFLNVYVDSTLAGHYSGLNKFGRAHFQVAQGLHQIKFEYAKDTSVDRGLDLARINAVVATDSSGVFSVDPCDGLDGTVPINWTPAGYGGGWICDRPTPPRAWLVPLASFRGVPPSQYAVDGHEAKGEYAFRQDVLPDTRFSAVYRSARLRMGAADNGGFQIGVHVPAATAAAGQEHGVFDVAFDLNRSDTVGGRGPCGNDSTTWHLPGPDDRYYALTYALGLTGTSYTQAALHRYAGSCNPASPLTELSTDSWNVSFRAAEDTPAPGQTVTSYFVEVRAVPPSLIGGAVGVGFWHANFQDNDGDSLYSRGDVLLASHTYPWHADGSARLIYEHMGSLESLYFGALTRDFATSAAGSEIRALIY